MDARRCTSRRLNKLDTLDKGRAGAASSSLRGVNAEADPCDTRCLLLAKVALEASVKVEFGYRHLARLGFAEANKAATCVKVTALIRKIYLFILAKKETNEIWAVRYQDMAARDLFLAKKDIQHQRFVVHLLLIGSLLRILFDASVNSNHAYLVEIHGIIEDETAHAPLSVERKDTVSDRKA